jgi:phage terminase large subunit GpA-like protein
VRVVRHPVTKERITLYDSIEEMVVLAAEAARPLDRISVSEAATRYHMVKRPPMHDGPFSLDKAPYLREPMDELTSLEHTGLVFVGPARTGKSAMFLNWMAHTAIHDPTDMMLVHMAQHTARTWSQADLAKMLRDSPEVQKRLVPGRQNDNTFDKKFLSGMRLEITWPTINNLSGKTLRYTWIMDYDREPIEIDKEGSKWDLTKKRTQTYKRYGMTVAETSPGFLVEDPKWLASAPHEAPPTKGLLAVYNEGDRRRWYWRCPQCHSAFEPHRRYLVYPASLDPMEAAEQVVMVCPHDGFPMTPDMQHELNLGGRWVKEGQLWMPDSREPLVGTARRSPIASFWMFGPAAAFTDWGELTYKLLTAEAKFESNGDEAPIQTVINTDFGEPYTLKATEAGRLPEELRKRAQAYSGKGEVPEGVGFLVTTIDVQAGGRPSFVCHTYGIGPGISPEELQAGHLPKDVDIWHVDMWKIRKSERRDEDGERKLLDPASFPEDWDCLIPQVVERTYPLSDGSGRHMRVKIIACDSGGAGASGNSRQAQAKQDGPKVSVTSNAYEFWRRLKKRGDASHIRFHLVKGAPSPSAPEMHKTFPDSQQKDKFAIARGDVPVWLVNSNKVKDRVYNKLGRNEPGGQIHFPVWYDDDGTPIDTGWLYSQLTTEIRTTRGWENPARRRNEAFDLLAYCIGICLTPQIRLEFINWTSPPDWATPDWDRNSMVFDPTAAIPDDDGDGDDGTLDIEDLAGRLG